MIGRHTRVLGKLLKPGGACNDVRRRGVDTQRELASNFGCRVLIKANSTVCTTSNPLYLVTSGVGGFDSLARPPTVSRVDYPRSGSDSGVGSVLIGPGLLTTPHTTLVQILPHRPVPVDYVRQFRRIDIVLLAANRDQHWVFERSHAAQIRT